MDRTIIRVFLGSPGDLEKERAAAKAVVDEENENNAKKLGYQIELVGWEGIVSQRGRAQEVINGHLDLCECFVGLVWKKWGTAPGPDGHPYTSGFEEEYGQSVKRHEKSGKPEISLLFKNIPEDFMADPGDQLRKVLEFRRKVREEKKQLYQEFGDLDDFKYKFRAIITKFLHDRRCEDGKFETREPQKLRQKDEKSKDQYGGQRSLLMFDAGATAFIKDFITKEPIGDKSISAAEVARFRLLACSVSRPGNEHIQLGTHDANLIYRDLREVEFSEWELSKLVSRALESLDSFTVPLWHWIFRPSYEIKIDLPLQTFLGKEKNRTSAFKLLGMLSVAPKDFEHDVDTTDYRDIWFSQNVSNELIISALEYLGVVGDEGLQVDWDQLIGSSEAIVSCTAVRSLVRIKSRVNTTDALRFVAAHENVDLGIELSNELLSNVKTIETKVLRVSLINRTRTFRRGIATALVERDSLTESDAYLLCESNEADIRLIGVKALAKLNHEFSFFDVERHLVKQDEFDSSGQSSSQQGHDYLGRAAFEDYKIGAFCKMPYQQLLDAKKDESVFGNGATIALYRGHFSKEKADLEKNLLDGFDEFCVGRAHALGELGLTLDDSTYSYIRKKWLQSALEAFCVNAGKLDLSIVRKVLDEYDVQFSTEVIEFIAKHGEWEDTARIAKLSGKITKVKMSYIDDSKDDQLAAGTILKLGAKRIADVWKLDLPDKLRVQIVVQMSKNLFNAYDDQGLVDMLLWDSAVVRQVVALTSILHLPKARLSKILDTYCNAGARYFYDAVFWLDLGVSADRKTSRAIAGHARNVIISKQT